MNIEIKSDRRRLLIAAASGAILAGVAGCDKEDEEDVGAVEDLMREHGVIRRAILVYRASAVKLRAGTPVDPQALRQTAALLRDFAEEYHEKKLEEAHIFPAVKKAGGAAAAYVDVLLAQHERGRAITEYILGVVSKGGTGDGAALADAMDGFELMYAHHAAREDTVVFPAWKKIMSKHALAEMGEKFEDIEKQQFGKDGFDDAVTKIDRIEQTLGLGDIAQFTPKAP